MESKKYRYIWSEKRSLINVESHLRQYLRERDILGSTHRYSFIYGRNGIAEELHREKDNRRWVKAGQRLLRKENFKTLLREGAKLRSDFKNFITLLWNTNCDAYPSTTLIAWFEKSCSYHSRLRGYFKTSRGEFLTAAETTLKRLLRRRLGDTRQLQKIFEILTTPSALDEVNRESIAWIKLLTKNKKYSTTHILGHLRRYPWLVAHSHNVNRILLRSRTRYHHDRRRLRLLRARAQILRTQKRRLAIRQRYWLGKINNSQVRYLARLFREASLERMRLKGGWSGSDFLYSPLYSAIARRTKIPKSDLYSWYRIDEVIAALKSHKKITKEQLTRRKKAYVLWLKNSRIQFISGSPAVVVIKKELRHQQKERHNKILYGQTASLGIAKGRVQKIIPGGITVLDHALRDFKPGKILVTTMTQPKMVPLMRRAAAMVTDEGCLTEPAATEA